MNFEPSDIVQIVHYPLAEVIGRQAEVKSVHPNSVLRIIAPHETWYVVTDVTGAPRAVAHSWLRRADPVPINQRQTETENTVE